MDIDNTVQDMTSILTALDEANKRNAELSKMIEQLTEANKSLVDTLTIKPDVTATAENAATQMLNEALSDLIGGNDNGSF